MPVLQMSAKTGEGFEALTELLDQQGAFGRKILDIDYDIYAEGEAELGWLNAASAVTAAAQPFDLDGLLMRAGDAAARGVRPAWALEVAHLKVIGLRDGSFGVANLVSSGDAAGAVAAVARPGRGGGGDRQRPRRRRPGGDRGAGAADDGRGVEPGICGEGGGRGRCRASAPAGRSRRTATPRRSEGLYQARS